MGNQSNATWEVPYLPIDPSDLGRKYEPLVRINSQSGKGGIAFVLERAAGYRVPKGLAIEFSHVIQRITDGTGKELRPEAVVSAFDEEFLVAGSESPDVRCEIHRRSEEVCEVSGVVRYRGEERSVQAVGNGPIDAFLKGFNRTFGCDLHCVDYSEHALDEREDAKAISYVQLRMGDRVKYGVGIANDISIASLRAVVSAATRFAVTVTTRIKDSRPGFASESAP
ncbi:MAG: alpha-isopropylmalate synthase regulatory domain-containing protein [Polyangiaceae bacterium]